MFIDCVVNLCISSLAVFPFDVTKTRVEPALVQIYNSGSILHSLNIYLLLLVIEECQVIKYHSLASAISQNS